MRALAGPAMLLVIAGGFMYSRMTSGDEAPSREFTGLEFAGADRDHTGSCYSLSTVLIANRGTSGAVRTWTAPREDAWTLMLEAVLQEHGGPLRWFQELTFEKHEDQVRLVQVEASENFDTDLKYNIDGLLEAPKAFRSTPIDRCLTPGATGYLFVQRH
jgi:hypothetical protein